MAAKCRSIQQLFLSIKPQASTKQNTDIGIKIFSEFFSLYLQKLENISLDSANINKVLETVKEKQSWVENFLSLYGTVRVDFEGSVPALEICTVRSGLQYLLELLAQDSKWNKVSSGIKEEGELEEFDLRLNVWIKEGFRQDLRLQDIPKSVQHSHWWWYDDSRS